MTVRATRAAHDLAAVLTAQAENLASDQLSVISEAMAAVRSAARELESALTDRGWGGGVLYGWGNPLDDEDNDPDEDSSDLDLEDIDDEEDEDEALDEGVEDGGPWVAPAGQRMSYQARYDFFVVDEAMFTEYVVQRATQAGIPEARARDYVLEQGTAFVLTELIGFGSLDFAGTGLEFAGGQDGVGPVPVTLWEMDDEVQEDQFPTQT